MTKLYSKRFKEKQLKALEILKRSIHILDGSGSNMFTDDEIDEAIAELEVLQDEVKDAEWRLDLCLAQQRAMQEHKTCDGCMFDDGIGYKAVCQTCNIHLKLNYLPKEQ